MRSKPQRVAVLRDRHGERRNDVGRSAGASCWTHASMYTFDGVIDFGWHGADACGIRQGVVSRKGTPAAGEGEDGAGESSNRWFDGHD
ncbi:hypothetical protein D3C86_1925390 [compost metagenome]